MASPVAAAMMARQAPTAFFWGDNGEQLTPAQAQAQQEMAQALMTRQSAPHTIGEGLNSLGDSLVAKAMMQRGMGAQQAGLQKATADFSALEADPSKAIDFLANDQFASDGQKAVAQALMTQKMMASNPQIQAQIANLQSETGKNNAEAGMFANGGAAIGAPVQDSAGNYYIPTQYGGTMRPLSAPGQAAPAAPGPIDSPSANAGAVPVPAAAGAATGAPASVAPPAAQGAPAPQAGAFLTPAQQAEQKAEATKAGENAAGRPTAMVAAKNSLEQLADSDKLVSGFIDQAIQEASAMGSTGWVGKLSEQIPGTPAYKLARTLDTVKANIGFDKLQAMRAASPSGGALGQVSNFEEQLLQAVLGSLDQGQDAPVIMGNLVRLKQFTASNAQQRQAAFQADFGGVKPLSGDPNFNKPPPVAVTDAASYATVPKGAQYKAPDGSVRVKQ